MSSRTGVASFSLKYDTIDKLDRYAKQTMIPKTRVIERALEDYFEKVGFETEGKS